MKRNRVTSLVLWLAVAMGARLAVAVSGTWNGTTDGTWATGSNWSTGAAPGRPDTAIFNGAGNGNTAINVGTGVVVSNLVLDTGAAAYSFGGSGGLAATNAFTMNANASQTFNVPFTAPYVSDANNPFNLANNGSGAIIFNNTYGFTTSRRGNFSPMATGPAW